MLELSGQAHRIDDYSVPWYAEKYIDAFWEVRRFYGNDTPVTPRMLADCCADRGILLDRQERDIIYRMDIAYRSAWRARQAENDKARLESKGK